MRKLRRRVGSLLLSVLLAAGTSACEETTGPGSAAGFRAVWAGSDWKANASATVASRGGVDSLHVLGSNPPGSAPIVLTYVRISVPVRGTGEYALGRGDAEMTYLTGGDVTSAVYATTRAGAGTLSITRYGDGWVAGTVKFEAEAARSHRPVGPAARFEGSFRAPIRRQP
ncbi:MAG TPA: hypothetical protein VGV85_08545 [Longimicrobiaceae bacterium]|nr:hypothetical protein [Longimicrobiaceae bacterium]